MQELPRRTARKTRREATGEPLTTVSSTSTATKDEDAQRSGLAENDLSGALPQTSAAAASPFLGSSRNSTSGSLVECWICFDPTSTPLNPIVTHRCRCRGSVGYVHQKCIDRWVIQQRNRACRSCGASYQLVHSEYPPGANLPLRPHERRVFLLKFLIKPLLLESAETLCCVLLRFFVLPLLLGLVYSFHRWPLLWRPMSTFAASPERNFSYTASVGVPGSQEVLENEDGTYTLTESFLAWADAILFGLVLCTVMNAVAVGWEKWNHYFRAARERLARETARRAEEGGLARAAAMPPVGPLDFHEENGPAEGVEERAEATEQGGTMILHRRSCRIMRKRRQRVLSSRGGDRNGDLCRRRSRNFCRARMRLTRANLGREQRRGQWQASSTRAATATAIMTTQKAAATRPTDFPSSTGSLTRSTG
ncbi:Zn-finger domain protein [Leishmania donovani]|uniref:Zn-finger_domain_protein_putative/GeneDB:LmjF.29. 1630 n=1 Tax=Leishmania donovani TaxID=5661 RepID=A0A6J8FKR5_LEIDO|nr:Zn-finger domain protein [Leishmania donovani]VDZ46503.1 Zn-finger_domain_protein_putative/GeneDB:LmjF.29.1630 [Leishmania donovani]